MLTPNEIRLHSGVSGWAVNPDTGAVVYLHRRSPSSTDLMLLADGRLSTLEEGISIIGRPVWTDRQLVYQSGHQLLRLSPLSPDPQSPEVLFEIDSAAAFVESPVRFNGDSLLFVLKGQSVPRLMKLVDGTATCVLVGPRGSRFVSYAAHGDQIVVALAFAEAMTAHVQVPLPFLPLEPTPTQASAGGSLVLHYARHSSSSESPCFSRHRVHGEHVACVVFCVT